MKHLLLLLLFPALLCAQEPPKISRFVEFNQEVTDVYTIHEPGATFIKVHMRVRGNTTVRSSDGRESYRYSSSQKDRHTKHGKDLGAMSITGDTAIIEVKGGKATITGYDVGLVEMVYEGTPEITCGLSDIRHVRCYESSEPAAFERRRPVARIHMSGGGLCTAWRVGAGTKMITNQHCVATQEGIAGAEIWFNFEYPTCTGGVSATYKVPGDTFLMTNQALDFTLFTVQDTPEVQRYGWFGLEPRQAAVGDRIYMLGHPGGTAKKAIIDSDVNDPPYCQIDDESRGGSGQDYGYMCDSEGGQSGSPVLDYRNGRAIALHHIGACQNQGVKMAKIWPLIASYFNDTVPLGDQETPVTERPVAKPTVSCVENVCAYDSAGSVADSVSWDFGDQSYSSEPSGTHTYTIPGDIAVTLFATLGGITDSETVVVKVIVPGYNGPPIAAFEYTISGLTVNLHSTAYDPEGQLAQHSWRVRDPLDGIWHYYTTPDASHTFAQSGKSKYADLTVKDAQGLSSTTSFKTFDLAAPPPACGDGVCNGTETYATCPADCPPPPEPVCGDGRCDADETWQTCPADCDEPPAAEITITYTAKRLQGPDYQVTIKWLNAVGNVITLFRNGVPGSTANDGVEVFRMHKREKGTPFRICDAEQCSRTMTVDF